MDTERFDTLVRSWVAMPRRATLRALVVSAVAALVGGESATAAPCLAPGARCRTSSSCCSGRCKKRKGHHKGKCTDCRNGKVYCPAVSACQACCADSDCTGGAVCEGKFCSCLSGQMYCKGNCTCVSGGCNTCTSDAGCRSLTQNPLAMCRTDNGTCGCAKGQTFCEIPCPG